MTRASEHIGLSVLALVAAALIVWLALPVGVGLLMGTLMAFSLDRSYQRLSRRWGRPRLAALVCVAVTTLVFSAALAWLGYLLVTRGVDMARATQAAFEPGGQGRALAKQITDRLDLLHVSPEILVSRIGDAATGLAGYSAGAAAAIAGASLRALLAIFFAVMTAYFILRHWQATAKRIEALLPIDPRYTRALLEEFRRVGRTVLLGTVLTGLAQGLLAGFGYWITGVPQAAFFGALTAVASLLPGVGTLLVWVPAGIYLFFTAHPAAALAELIYGAVVVVCVSDYVIRPKLIGDHGGTPALLTFVALFGGVETMGLVGLIVGPVVMSVALALLRIYENEVAPHK